MKDSKPEHSPIGASSMSRWANCPGSIRLSRGIPSTTSPYAAEGTLAHEHAAHRLDKGQWREDISDEMKEAVSVYTTVVEYDRQDVGSRVQHGTEYHFDLSKIHTGLYGTADKWIYDPATKFLRVYDYKHGAGLPVEVKGNKQLMYYGLGAMLSLGFPVEEVELVIVQPRCPHKDGSIRRWKFPAFDLLEFAGELDAYAKATEAPDAPLVPGSHCKFCPAAALCPSIHQKAQAMAKLEFTPALLQGTPSLADPVTLCETLHFLPTLEGWIKSVYSYAQSELEAGRPVAGWKLVAKRATRKWSDPVKTAQYLESEFPQTSRELFETALKSPAQVEKILHKNQHEKLMPFISAISSGSSLVPESDPRPEIKVLDAKTEFAIADLFS